MKIIIFLICLNPIFGSTYLLAQNVFSQDYIKEVKANGQLLFLKELDRYNLNDQTKILSHAVNLKNQISLQDGYYAVISGEIEPIINHILLIIDGKVTKLTTKECELLTMLAQNANNILERNYALKTIWVEDNYFNARSMDVYITKLRKLLKDDPNVEIINIHGKGYKLIIPNE